MPNRIGLNASGMANPLLVGRLAEELHLAMAVNAAHDVAYSVRRDSPEFLRFELVKTTNVNAAFSDKHGGRDGLTKRGKQNRARLGIVDVNLLGWSQSMPSLGEPMYQAILDLAETEKILPLSPIGNDFTIPDNWGTTKTRGIIKRFSDPVMARSNSTCIVCGTSLPGLVEAAHLSPYAVDKKNRANPANSICLCKYRHRALDLRLIAIQPDGTLLVAPFLDDQVANHHFSWIEPERRLRRLKGVGPEFLKLTVRWFHESLPNDSVQGIASLRQSDQSRRE